MHLFSAPDYVAKLATQDPIVLMGRGHSGTRVLAWICKHLGVRLGTETERETADPGDRTFTRQIKKIAVRNIGISSVQDIEPADLRRFQRAVSGYHRRLDPRGVWGWKFPETYLIAPYVHRTFPRARYLHLVRDGRDLAFKDHLTDDPTYTLGRRILKHLGALDQPRHLQAARSWAFQVETFEAFRRHQPDLQVFDLTFEDLVRDPVESTHSVCDFLAIPFTAEARSWIESNINRGKIAQYRSEDLDQVRDVEEAIGGALRTFGYL